MSITTPPKDYQVLFLDMNSYFASIEQQVQPNLRGRPIAVAPYTGNTGCVIAASYEAKALGIKCGTLVGEAKKIYPKIQILEARPSLYMFYHQEIRKALEKLTPYYQALSVDEFTIRLTPREQSCHGSIELAKKVKSVITGVGDSLRCSIGIAPSTFLAKMAAESKKPDGLTLWEIKNLEKYYSEMKLTDITGINFRLARRLQQKGIMTALDFFNLNVVDQIRILNHPGRLWYFRLRGYDVDDFMIKTKTIGHSHVLAPEFRTKTGAISVLHKLIFKTGARLRKEGYWAGGIFVAIRFNDQESFHQGKKVPLLCDNKTFLAHAYDMLKNCRWSGRPSYVAVSTFNLVKNISDQPTLFAEVNRSRELSKALDSINDEYGVETIVPASLLFQKGVAPDRIPFGRPRYEIKY